MNEIEKSVRILLYNIYIHVKFKIFKDIMQDVIKICSEIFNDNLLDN